MSTATAREFDITFEGSQEQPDGSFIGSDGAVTWYNKDGQRHNETGPSCISAGKTFWSLNDNSYSFNEWCIELSISDETKMLLKLQYE